MALYRMQRNHSEAAAPVPSQIFGSTVYDGRDAALRRHRPRSAGGAPSAVELLAFRCAAERGAVIAARDPTSKSQTVPLPNFPTSPVFLDVDRPGFPGLVGLEAFGLEHRLDGLHHVRIAAEKDICL